MAVKDCDDIVEEATTTETAEETVEQQKKPRPKRTRQVQAQVSLGKTIEIVEKNVYDNLVTEGDAPLVELSLIHI